MDSTPSPTAAVFAPTAWVLDTNIVLDVWVFDDPSTHALRQMLGVQTLAQMQNDTPTPSAQPPWLATPVMREELARVLAYPHLVRRQALDARVAAQVLAAYDARVTFCTPASKAPYICRDKDDQKFIDLAVAHASLETPLILLSKDHAVLRLRKRLSQVGVLVGSSWPLPQLAPLSSQSKSSKTNFGLPHHD